MVQNADKGERVEREKLGDVVCEIPPKTDLDAMGMLNLRGIFHKIDILRNSPREPLARSDTPPPPPPLNAESPLLGDDGGIELQQRSSDHT